VTYLQLAFRDKVLDKTYLQQSDILDIVADSQQLRFSCFVIFIQRDILVTWQKYMIRSM